MNIADMIKNRKLSMLQKGTEDTLVLFIHGGPGLSHHYFSPLIENISAGYSFVSYEQGSVHDKNDDWSVDALVSEIDELVNLYKKENLILVAHSFGSVPAVEYASKKKPPVAMILLNWIYDNHWLDLFRAKNTDLSNVYKRYEDLCVDVVDPKTLLKNRMLSYSEYYFDQNDISKGEEMLAALNYHPEISITVEKKWTAEVDTKLNLNNLKIPILSIGSATDQIILPQYHDDIQKFNPEIKHYTVADGGHFSCFTRPLQVSKIINEFIKSIE